MEDIMMGQWVLILAFFVPMTFGDSPMALTSVYGFKTLQSCQAAGQMAKNEFVEKYKGSKEVKFVCVHQ